MLEELSQGKIDSESKDSINKPEKTEESSRIGETQNNTGKGSKGL